MKVPRTRWSTLSIFSLVYLSKIPESPSLCQQNVFLYGDFLPRNIEFPKKVLPKPHATCSARWETGLRLGFSKCCGFDKGNLRKVRRPRRKNSLDDTQQSHIIHRRCCTLLLHLLKVSTPYYSNHSLIRNHHFCVVRREQHVAKRGIFPKNCIILCLENKMSDTKS